jgi:hypothetical protein
MASDISDDQTGFSLHDTGVSRIGDEAGALGDAPSLTG